MIEFFIEFYKFALFMAIVTGVIAYAAAYFDDREGAKLLAWASLAMLAWPLIPVYILSTVPGTIKQIQDWD